MENQVELREVKSMDVQCVMAGVSILFSILAAVFGYESLSIGGVMIFALVCVMGGMIKDWVDLCKDLVDEE
jgi:UDP-N-acetylmuramyl pentapeptide phosphotransferase/UDP-N-acetylglucosamine-1-phosphate transferase